MFLSMRLQHPKIITISSSLACLMAFLSICNFPNPTSSEVPETNMFQTIKKSASYFNIHSGRQSPPLQEPRIPMVLHRFYQKSYFDCCGDRISLSQFCSFSLNHMMHACQCNFDCLESGIVVHSLSVTCVKYV